MAGRARNLVPRVERAWFAGLDSGTPSSDLFSRWFGKSDEEIKAEFEGDLVPAAAGEYRELEESAEGTLALIVLFDQFTRNIFRGTAGMFAYDSHALRLAHHALDRGFDRDAHPYRRMFFYLPLEHSEDPEMQALSVGKAKQLHQEVPEDYKEAVQMFMDYAQKHKDVIDRFGRFPHRNEALGRETTEEERKHLEEHGGF